MASSAISLGLATGHFASGRYFREETRTFGLNSSHELGEMAILYGEFRVRIDSKQFISVTDSPDYQRVTAF